MKEHCAINKTARLRVCASCEWIFKEPNIMDVCPKCGFAHYGARWVYGNKYYRYAETQQPWIDKKLTDYTHKLLNEVKKERIQYWKGEV